MSNWALIGAISTLIPVFGGIWKFRALSKYWLWVVFYTVLLQVLFIIFHFIELNSSYLNQIDYLATLGILWIGIDYPKGRNLITALFCSFYLILAIATAYFGLGNTDYRHTILGHFFIIVTASLLVFYTTKEKPTSFLSEERFWIGVAFTLYFLVALIVNIAMWKAYHNDNHELFIFLRPLAFLAGISFNFILFIPVVVAWYKKT